MEHGKHGGILSENRSTELPDTGEPCGLHQSCQEHGAQAVVLEIVGYYEGDLSPAGLFAPVIAANSDDLALALNHVGNSIEAVDTSEVRDLFRIQVAVQVEEAQSNGPVAQLCVESDECIGVTRSDRPYSEVTDLTSPSRTGHKCLGIDQRHTATVTSPIGAR